MFHVSLHPIPTFSFYFFFHIIYTSVKIVTYKIMHILPNMNIHLQIVHINIYIYPYFK